jgi:thymidylate synthase (FAD)
MRVVDPKNKQSSVMSADQPRSLAFQYAVGQWSKHALQGYRDMVEGGVAREMARMVLPVNIYTKFWFTVNARSLMNFLMLRNHPNAQYEIQVYAVALERLFQEAMPWTHEAFVLSGRKAP